MSQFRSPLERQEPQGQRAEPIDWGRPMNISLGSQEHVRASAKPANTLEFTSPYPVRDMPAAPPPVGKPGDRGRELRPQDFHSEKHGKHTVFDPRNPPHLSPADAARSHGRWGEPHAASEATRQREFEGDRLNAHRKPTSPKTHAKGHDVLDKETGALVSRHIDYSRTFKDGHVEGANFWLKTGDTKHPDHHLRNVRSVDVEHDQKTGSSKTTYHTGGGKTYTIHVDADGKVSPLMRVRDGVEHPVLHAPPQRKISPTNGRPRCG